MEQTGPSTGKRGNTFAKGPVISIVALLLLAMLAYPLSMGPLLRERILSDGLISLEEGSLYYKFTRCNVNIRGWPMPQPKLQGWYNPLLRAYRVFPALRYAMDSYLALWDVQCYDIQSTIRHGAPAPGSGPGSPLLLPSGMSP